MTDNQTRELLQSLERIAEALEHRNGLLEDLSQAAKESQTRHEQQIAQLTDRLAPPVEDKDDRAFSGRHIIEQLELLRRDLNYTIENLALLRKDFDQLNRLCQDSLPRSIS